MTKDFEVNGRINAYKVRLIDENGQQVGVKHLREAIAYAQSLDLDLVKISDANPPVCKVLDAGKFLYDMQKQAKIQAKKQRETRVDTKEIQLRPVTDVNDRKVKSRKAKEFLQDGDKVRIVMRFRGREQAHKDIGKALIDEFIQELGECKIDQALTDAGRSISIIVAPIK